MLACISMQAWSQRLDPLTSDPSRRMTKLSKNPSVDLVLLPFFDDFYSYSGNPDTTLWEENGGTFVNNSFGINPPSAGVVTFDGLNANGEAYNPFDPAATGSTDELVSKPIRLSPSMQKVHLTFFYQPSGNGSVQPNPGDSLKVFLLDSNGIWNQVWSEYIDSARAFKQKLIPIKDSIYLYEGFKFKFVSYGNRSGMFDLWNLDYIYLDQNVDSSKVFDDNDIAISNYPTSYLKRYTAMPYKQFLANKESEIADSIYATVNDVEGDGGPPVVFGQRLILTETANSQVVTMLDTTVVVGNGVQQHFVSTADTTLDVFNINGPTEIEAKVVIESNDRSYGDTISPLIPDTIFTANDTILANVGDMMLHQNILYRLEAGQTLNLSSGDSVCLNGDTLILSKDIALAPQGEIQLIDLSHNDSVITTTVLDDYFAYDDGSAEKTFVMTQQFGVVAYRFDINKKDTLSGVDMYFPPNVKGVDGESIDLVVWHSLAGIDGDVDSVLLEEPIAAYFAEEANQFTNVQYTTRIEVEDHFYVGWRVRGAEEVHVGYDVNSSSGNSIYVKMSDNWSTYLEDGALMIRPIVGDRYLSVEEKVEEKQHIKVYPNPTMGVVNFSTPQRIVQVFSMFGELLNEFENTRSIDLTYLPSGMYLLKSDSESGITVEKLTIQH